MVRRSVPCHVAVRERSLQGQVQKMILRKCTRTTSGCQRSRPMQGIVQGEIKEISNLIRLSRHFWIPFFILLCSLYFNAPMGAPPTKHFAQSSGSETTMVASSVTLKIIMSSDFQKTFARLSLSLSVFNKVKFAFVLFVHAKMTPFNPLPPP